MSKMTYTRGDTSFEIDLSTPEGAELNKLADINYQLLTENSDKDDLILLISDTLNDLEGITADYLLLTIGDHAALEMLNQIRVSGRREQ